VSREIEINASGMLRAGRIQNELRKYKRRRYRWSQLIGILLGTLLGTLLETLHLSSAETCPVEEMLFGEEVQFLITRKRNTPPREL